MLSFDNKPVSGLLEIRSYMHSSPRLVLRNSTITAAAIIVIVAWAIRKPIDASQLCFNGKEIGSKRDEVSKGILLSLIDMEGSNYGDCKCQYTVAAIAGVCSLSSEKVKSELYASEPLIYQLSTVAVHCRPNISFSKL